MPPEPPDEAVPGRALGRLKKSRRGAAGRRDKGRARRLFLLVGAAPCCCSRLAGAFYFFQNRKQLFPNSKEEAPAPAPAAKAANDPILRARPAPQGRAGTTAVEPAQAHPAERPALRPRPGADRPVGWRRRGRGDRGGSGRRDEHGGRSREPGATGEPAPPLTPEALARRAAFLAAAHQAADERSSFKALRAVSEAADALAELDGDDARLLADTRRKLKPLNNQIDLFHQHEWERVLPQLWRLHGSDPSNRDVTQMIVDCYYDLALRDLQRTDAAKAAASLKEAVNLQPGDDC